jgi:hypothetical protein
MDVIRKAMRQHDRPARGWALLEKGGFQDLGRTVLRFDILSPNQSRESAR